MIEFEFDGKKYRLNDLTAEQLSEASFKYAMWYNKCIQNGILTNEQMVDVLIERKLWTEEETKQKINLQNEINELEKKLSKTKAKTKQLSIAMRLRNLRNQLVILQSKQSELMKQTAESLADQYKTQWIIFIALADEDGNRLYTDYDDFVRSMDPVVAEAAKQYIYSQLGFDADKSTPEDAILMAHGKMDRNGFLLDDKGRLVNESGQLIDKLYRLVDEEGFLINQEGDYINENGSIVSIDNKVKGLF